MVQSKPPYVKSFVYNENTIVGQTIEKAKYTVAPRATINMVATHGRFLKRYMGTKGSLSGTKAS
jgi:hypothetical protein